MACLQAQATLTSPMTCPRPGQVMHRVEGWFKCPPPRFFPFLHSPTSQPPCVPAQHRIPLPFPTPLVLFLVISVPMPTMSPTATAAPRGSPRPSLQVNLDPHFLRTFTCTATPTFSNEELFVIQLLAEYEMPQPRSTELILADALSQVVCYWTTTSDITLVCTFTFYRIFQVELDYPNRRNYSTSRRA